MDTSDEELVDQYIRGDEKALTALIQRHIKSVYSFARSICSTDEEAEDVTQETFVKLWKNIHAYIMGHNFKSWLLTIARNTAYDHLRKRKNIAFSQFEDEEGKNKLVETLPGDDITAIDMIVTEENKERVHTALKELSPLYREVLTLRYGEELTFDEIGVIVEKPLNTVKSQHRRALIQLRKILQNTALSAPR